MQRGAWWRSRKLMGVVAGRSTGCGVTHSRAGSPTRRAERLKRAEGVRDAVS